MKFLKDIGEYDNTIVIFLSDNGSNPWYSEDYLGNRGSSPAVNVVKLAPFQPSSRLKQRIHIRSLE